MRTISLILPSLILVTTSLFSQPIAEPALPVGLCDVPVTMPDTIGYVRKTVGKGGGYDYNKLQKAIDEAVPGTVLLLAPDTFEVPYEQFLKGQGDDNGSTHFAFVLRNKNVVNNKWVVIMPLLHQYLPATGVRINPEGSTGNATYPKVRDAMPKFPTAHYGDRPVWGTETGASHYYLLGLDCFVDPNYIYDGYMSALIDLGNGGGAIAYLPEWVSSVQDSLHEVAHHLVMDRCFMHSPNNVRTSRPFDIKRGVGLNSGHTAIVNCSFIDIVRGGGENQGIAGYNGTGTYRINNNYIEATGINFLYGGAWISLPQVAQDMEFRNNHCIKKTQWSSNSPNWDGSNYCIKNNFELKQFKRAIIEGNIFENCWEAYCQGQKGYGIVITTRSYQGGPMSELTDVTIQNNITKNTQNGVNILGVDDLDVNMFENGVPHPPGYAPTQVKRVKIFNNIFLIDPVLPATGSGVFQMINSQDLIIDHNTCINPNGRGLMIYGRPDQGGTSLNNQFTNNIFYHSGIVAQGEDGSLTGEFALANVWPDVKDANQRFHKNVMPIHKNGYSVNYLHNVFFPNMMDWDTSRNYWTTPDSVFFVDSTNGRNNIQGFVLAGNSKWKNFGSDGKDVGADISQILTALAGPVTPSAPSSIVGLYALCAGSVSTFSVSPVNNATSYNWTLPGGWSGSSQTNTITATASGSSGNILVTASNTCNVSAAVSHSVLVNAIPDSNVIVNGMVLIAVETNAQYQWINCLTNSVIAGETSKSFTVTANGSYAVVLSKNGCVDTSSCFGFNMVSASAGVSHDDQIAIVPIPSSGYVTIKSDNAGVVELRDVTGSLRMTYQVNAGANGLDLSLFSKGCYFLTFRSESNTAVKKIFLK